MCVCGFFGHLEDFLKQNSSSHLGRILVTIIRSVFYGDHHNDSNHWNSEGMNDNLLITCPQHHITVPSL